MKKLVLAAALAATCLGAQPVLAQDGPSRYLRCDGEPNNMTAGESFARLLGAVTLLGLFAPSPESPDPEARQFGADGVAVCTSLIEGTDGAGEDMESNPVRRIPLILARALHQIEAKNYAAALTDVELARAEAKAADLVGNPYFDRSMGLSFNRIAAAAHLRMGNPQLALDSELQNISDMRYSFVPSIYSGRFGKFVREVSPAQELQLLSSAQIMPAMFGIYSNELDEAGRFADAAEAREAYLSIAQMLEDEDEPVLSAPYARAALGHALAGNWERARERAEFAQSNMDRRIAIGKPEDDRANIVELLDLYRIVEQIEAGEAAAARRMFSGRSQWTVPSFGSVLEINTRLREGASEEELVGPLATSAEEQWQKRYDDLLAVQLENDTNNEDLFDLIVSYAKVDEFEARSKDTHRVEKSRLMRGDPDEKGVHTIITSGSLYSGIDSAVLHAGLQARHKGKQGFVTYLVPGRRVNSFVFTVAYTRFVDRGEDGVHPMTFVPADAVIAELEPVIPTREEAKRRKKERRNKD